jgi:hypothetical protein
MVIRYQTDPEPNQRAAEALVEFYRRGEAWINPTPFGIVSTMYTNATPEAIYTKLSNANVGNHFSVIEINENDEPIKVLTSFNGTTVSGSNIQFDNAALDAGKTKAELKAELDRYLDKIQNHGANSLTPQEKARLEHLSQLD